MPATARKTTAARAEREKSVDEIYEKIYIAILADRLLKLIDRPHVPAGGGEDEPDLISYRAGWGHGVKSTKCKDIAQLGCAILLRNVAQTALGACGSAHSGRRERLHNGRCGG